MRRMWMKKTIAVAVALVGLAIGTPARDSSAAFTGIGTLSMNDYTSYPAFLNQKVDPNVIILLDFGGAMLTAGYGNYPESHTSGPINISSNVAGTNLCNANKGYVAPATPPAGCPFVGQISGRDDQFDPTVTYFGMFNSMECYVPSSGQQFGGQTAKASIDSACPASTPWDGNFLNWLTMRQIDLARQVFYGGNSLSAGKQGNVHSLDAESSTGDSGSNATPDPFTGNTCGSSTCGYRFVKAAPAGSAGTRYPSASPAIPDQALFGVDSGNIYACACFVGGAGANAPSDGMFTTNLGSWNIKVDVTNEPASQTTGLAQNLPTTGVRTSFWFLNAGSGQAASNFGSFDTSGGGCGSLPQCINLVRSQAIGQWSPLAEGTYEALCYYRMNGGPCYQTTDFAPPSNSGSFTPTYHAAGDPFFFVANNQLVSCCKSFILMISAGKPTRDGNAPSQNPLPNFTEFQTTQATDFLPTATTVWPPPSTQNSPPGWLERIAYYGLTKDIRSDLVNAQNVKFYSVVLNGPSGDPTGSYKMASASLWGGFQDQNSDNIPQMTGQTCTFPHTPDNKPATALMPLTLPGFVAFPNDPTKWTSTSSPEWDFNRDCIPDTYFEAGDSASLTTAINNALAAIRKEAASGTSVSVLATSSTGEGTIYQAFFFPVQFEGQNQIQWLGYTQGLWVDEFGNIRQDFSQPGCTGPPDGRLVLQHDCIIKTRFDANSGNVLVDVFEDADGNGQADSTTPTRTITLIQTQAIWEAGGRLAYTAPGASCSTINAGVSCRRILTWTDANSNKAVDSNEVIEFTAANVATLCPYLAASQVANCTAGGASQTAAQGQATDLINFHRGFDGTTMASNLRNRTLTVVNPDNPSSSSQQVWKLGDVIDSTPAIVAAPKERYDVIYGDATYATFFQQYRHRREVAYIGANDGMLHAFNGGFYTAGDDPSTPTILEHGFLTKSPPSGSGITATHAAPPLGAELWALIPQELLPHLQWYASTNYTHVAYMDLKPYVTDVRIFCGDTTAPPNGSPSPCITGQSGTPSAGTVVHPGGWGTILIAGMRFGGSCATCPSGSGKPMTVNADFTGNGSANASGNTRTFYSAYYVLDITDPEQDPALLWVFTDASLGFTTSVPAVVRVSPLTSAKTDASGAKWLALFGSGPTSYDARSTQTAQFYAVNLVPGPSYNPGSGAFTGSVYSTGDANSFMGDIISLDANLDFRVDVIYAGNLICNGSTSSSCSGGTPVWVGKLYRLTTGGTRTGSPDPTNLAAWGLTASGLQVPTVLLATFTCSPTPCTGSTPAGPITAAPTVSADNNNTIWVFFGTGRFFGPSDKTNVDPQYFFGVKDPVANSTACTESTTTSCQKNNLLDVSNVSVCLLGVGTCGTTTSQVTGITGVTDYGSLITKITNTTNPALNMDGWFLTAPTAGERALNKPTVLGGSVFFTTFAPVDDICSAAGNGTLYSLYYLTGGSYVQSTIGTSPSGANTIIARSISLGSGLPSEMGVQIGAQGSGASGGASTAGCVGRMTGFIQASTGVLGQLCGQPALSVWSRLISWRDL